MALRVEADDFKRLFARSSQVDTKLRTALRRNIRDAATVAVADVQRTVLGTPVTRSAQPRSRGLRAGIAAGVKVSIMTGNTRVGVAVTSRGFLARAYDKPGPRGWRHPVFGNTGVWVSQVGRPGYFTQVIPKHQPQITVAVRAAMQEAVDSLKGTT